MPLMEEVREQMDTGPVYISFDIDALDPSFAPGTGITYGLSATVIVFCVGFFFTRNLARKPKNRIDIFCGKSEKPG